MNNNSKIVLITCIIAIAAVHVVIAVFTPQQWVLFPAAMYVIGAPGFLWSMWE